MSDNLHFAHLIHGSMYHDCKILPHEVHREFFCLAVFQLCILLLFIPPNKDSSNHFPVSELNLSPGQCPCVSASKKADFVFIMQSSSDFVK